MSNSIITKRTQLDLLEVPEDVFSLIQEASSVVRAVPKCTRKSVDCWVSFPKYQIETFWAGKVSWTQFYCRCTAGHCYEISRYPSIYNFLFLPMNFLFHTAFLPPWQRTIDGNYPLVIRVHLHVFSDVY